MEKKRDEFNDQEEIKWLYEKISYRFEETLVAALRKKELLPKDEKYNITPDFDNIEKWRISTTSHKDYTVDGPSIEKEDIKHMKGFLYLTKGGLEIEPSFAFEFEVKGSKFSFNPTTLQKVVKDDIQRENWSVHSLFGEDESFNVFDKEKEEHLKKLKDKTVPLLKGVGFSEDESQMMVVGAMKSNKFTDDITPEGLTGLSLKIRGQNLTNRD